MVPSDKNEPRQYRILVVDDDPGVRWMLEKLFAKEGFLCTVAEDGEKALARMQDREFDVVITDLRMPGLNGLDLLERIKAQSDTDVMVMTGHGGEVTFAEIIEKGAHDFVHKPLHSQELLLRLKRILKERSNREERR